MKNLAQTLMLVAGLSAGGAMAAGTVADAPVGDAAAGQAKSATCAACHGADGNSLLTENPKLAGQHAGYLASQITAFRQAVLTGGKEGRVNAIMGGMAAGLSDQDILDLAAYFSAQQMVPGETPESAVELGQALYRGGDASRGITACIACHGPRGNGTPLAGFPKISFQHAQYTKTQLEQFRSGERTTDAGSMMRMVAAKLTDADIEALSGYLAGLH